MSPARSTAPQRPAGIVTRLIACIVDGLMIGLMLVGSYLGWAFFKLLLDPRTFSWPASHFLLSMTVALGTGIVYFTFFWMTSGRTVGGALLGTRVTGLNGQVLRFPRALLRAGFCVVFPIGLFWLVINRHRRSVQDIVLRTQVVYDWTTALVPIPSTAVPDVPVLPVPPSGVAPSTVAPSVPATPSAATAAAVSPPIVAASEAPPAS